MIINIVNAIGIWEGGGLTYLQILLKSYEFSESIKNRQLTQCFERLQQLKNAGEEPVKLLGLVTANFRLYFQILSYDEFQWLDWLNLSDREEKVIFKRYKDKSINISSNPQE